MICLQLSILAHVLSDFILQTDETVKRKAKFTNRDLIGHLQHAIQVLAPLMLLILIYEPLKAAAYAVLITILHFALDVAKCRLESKSKAAGLGIFIADQVLHLTVIFFAWSIFSLKVNSFSVWFLKLFTEGKFESFRAYFTSNNIINFLSCVIVYLYVCCGGAVIVRKVLDINSLGRYMGEDVDPGCQTSAAEYGVQNGVNACNTALEEISAASVEHTLSGKANITVLRLQAGRLANLIRNSLSLRKTKGSNTGKYIGMLERIIIMTMYINNAWPAIGLVFTAKSIVRFREFDDTDRNRTFAEYFLIGTLTSTALAILGGALLKTLLY